MTSINTNRSATTALQTLRMIQKNMETTQDHVSTGKKVDKASDNSSVWTVATRMTSDNSSLNKVNDTMGLEKTLVDTTTTGLDNILTALSDIKDSLSSAKSASADRSTIQDEIASKLEQIQQYSDNTVANNNNWLSQDTSAAGFNADQHLVSSFSRSGNSVNVSTIDVDIAEFRVFDASGGTTSGTSSTLDVAVTKVATDASGGGITVSVSTSANDLKGFMDTVYEVGGSATTFSGSIMDMDISALTDTDADQSQLDAFIKIVSNTFDALTASNAKLGNVSAQIDSQMTYNQAMSDAQDSGIGYLVDADMDKEAARLSALQTQQQLAVTSLSTANQSTSYLTQLFQ